MQFSSFGEKFTSQAGIIQLMDDLGKAMAGDEKKLMLGGGNPATIPQVQQYFRGRMQKLLDDGTQFERMIGNYDSPRGEQRFIEALAELFQKLYGWDIHPENIALTAGSQISFFFLFNLLGGTFPDGSHKKILLPLTPEYIGYTDAGISEDLFTAQRPEIEFIDDHTFKYHVDFETLSITEEIGALCVSRPTNPTGNVLTNDEIQKLSDLAQQHNIPFIIDNAYGTPFPNIIFTEAIPQWDEHIIMCMSLSKLGLPGVRTGIVIAHEKITKAITSLNAITSLAPSSFGATLALDLVRSGEIIGLSQQVIQPFYQQRSAWAVQQLSKTLTGTDFYIHKSEGAIFLWLWCKDLPITSQELYHRLQARGVVVVPGHHFYPGLDQDHWQHKQECLRINYGQESEAVVAEGLGIIGEIVKVAYTESQHCPTQDHHIVP